MMCVLHDAHHASLTLLELRLHCQVLLDYVLHDAHHASSRAFLVALYELHQTLRRQEKRVALLLHVQAASVPERGRGGRGGEEGFEKEDIQGRWGTDKGVGGSREEEEEPYPWLNVYSHHFVPLF